jgi:hypothetical protein
MSLHWLRKSKLPAPSQPRNARRHGRVHLEGLRPPFLVRGHSRNSKELGHPNDGAASEFNLVWIHLLHSGRLVVFGEGHGAAESGGLSMQPLMHDQPQPTCKRPQNDTGVKEAPESCPPRLPAASCASCSIQSAAQRRTAAPI